MPGSIAEIGCELPDPSRRSVGWRAMDSGIHRAQRGLVVQVGLMVRPQREPTAQEPAAQEPAAREPAARDFRRTMRMAIEPLRAGWQRGGSVTTADDCLVMYGIGVVLAVAGR